MSRNNYEPSAWLPDENLQDFSQSQVVTDPQTLSLAQQTHRRGTNVNDNTFIDHHGRRCRVVCDQPRRPNLQQISRQILRQPLWRAQQIYWNIREVIRDGQALAVTQDFRPDRINVETRNGVIVRVVGFY